MDDRFDVGGAMLTELYCRPDEEADRFAQPLRSVLPHQVR
jgi:hypothetical protein